MRKAVKHAQLGSYQLSVLAFNSLSIPRKSGSTPALSLLTEFVDLISKFEGAMQIRPWCNVDFSKRS